MAETMFEKRCRVVEIRVVENVIEIVLTNTEMSGVT